MENGEYRGGPAYYIKQGLKQFMVFAILFALMFIFWLWIRVFQLFNGKYHY